MNDPYGYQQYAQPYQMTPEEQAEYEYLSQQLLHERDIHAARELSARIGALREGTGSQRYSPPAQRQPMPQQYPPVPYQQHPAAPYGPPSQPGEHRSERMVVEAPLSFTGSQKRIWRALTWNSLRNTPWFPFVLAPTAVLLILCAWAFVLCWYCTFGLLVVPYRMIRRSSRNQKVQAARHAEMMSRLPR